MEMSPTWSIQWLWSSIIGVKHLVESYVALNFCSLAESLPILARASASSSSRRLIADCSCESGS